jgi:hypothetical protein
MKLDRTGSSEWVVRAKVWNGKGDATAKVNSEVKHHVEVVAKDAVDKKEAVAQEDRQG